MIDNVLSNEFMSANQLFNKLNHKDSFDKHYTIAILFKDGRTYSWIEGVSAP